MSKIEALLEVIHLCEENPRLVRALEDLLIEDGPVKVAPENGAAPKQQAPEAPAEEVKAEAAQKPKKRNGGVAGSQSWTQDGSRPCGPEVGRWQRSPTM